jgi:hypothetical protein
MYRFNPDFTFEADGIKAESAVRPILFSVQEKKGAWP